MSVKVSYAGLDLSSPDGIHRLDKRLGTSPWLVLVMVLGGAALGFWSLVRRAR